MSKNNIKYTDSFRASIWAHVRVNYEHIVSNVNIIK